MLWFCNKKKKKKGNVRKHRDIKLVTDKRRNQLASEPSYHTTKYFSENLMVIDMKKAKGKMNSRSILACQYYTLAKHLCMNFGMIALNQISRQSKTMLYGY